MKKQTYDVEIKKSIFFANSSPEAIAHLVQKALFTYQKITPDRSAEFWDNASALKFDLSE